MKASNLNQKGFGHIAVLFVLVFVAVVGFAGYKVFTMNKSADTTVSSVVANPTVPSRISTKADLTATAKALDSSSSQVDSNLNDGALNSDLNDML
jgi:hypothetical protein